MIHDIQDFTDPITFSHTGFVYNTWKRSLETTLDASIGIQRPWPNKTGRVLFRALAEVDLKQIEHLQKALAAEGSKSNVHKVEFDTLLRAYKEETFFSLFKGEALIYDSIQQSLKMRMRSVKQTTGEEDDPRAASVRSLEHVMDRPLPVYTEKKEN